MARNRPWKVTGVLCPGRIVSAWDGGAWSVIAGCCILLKMSSFLARSSNAPRFFIAAKRHLKLGLVYGSCESGLVHY